MARLVTRTAGLRATGLGVLAAAALALTACGGSDNANLDNGKDKFTQLCGSCHALADAGTKGIIGPNLDDAFRGARVQGFEPSSFEGIIKYWIANPEPLNINNAEMPANLVTGEDADDVAAYIAATAGTVDDESPVRPAEEIE